MSKPAFRVHKTLSLRILIREIYTPLQVPWSKCISNLVLQISKAAGWDIYLGTLGITLVCQDPCAGCCKLLPTSPSQSYYHWLSTTESPVVPMGLRPDEGPPQCWGSWLSPLALFSHWRNWRLSEDLSAWYCPGLGRDNVVNCVAISLTLLCNLS